jgi:hypothetical protein
LARQALFGEGVLRLKDAVVATPATPLSALFENAGALVGPSLAKPLDLAPGYHYLDAETVRQRLSQGSPALARLAFGGDGVRVYVQQGGPLPDPLAGRPPAFSEAPVVPVAPSVGGGELYLFTRDLEGRTVIPRGTPVLIGRDGGRVLMQLSGTLLRDFDFTRPMRVKLTHGGVTLERLVEKDQVAFY